MLPGQEGELSVPWTQGTTNRESISKKPIGFLLIILAASLLSGDTETHTHTQRKRLSTDTESAGPLDLQPPGLWVINICCVRHAVSGISLPQPELSKTVTPARTKAMGSQRWGTLQLHHDFLAMELSWGQAGSKEGVCEAGLYWE